MFIKYDYTEDIRNHRFEELAALLRKGDLSALEQEARDLLADYLLGYLKRGRGAPRKDEALEAEHLFTECEHLMKYGMMWEDFLAYCQENITTENYK